MKIVRPVVVTETVLTSSNVAETEAAWSAVTAYSIGNAVRRTIDGIHIRFVALTANTNKVPEDNPADWQNEGATNRYEMFDSSVQSQTENADSIAVQLAIPGRIDTLALLNVEGLTAQVTLTDAVDGVIYDEEYSLVSTLGINDWAAYFREPIVRKDELILTDLPPYANPTLNVTIEDLGATAKCGVLLPGYSREIGETLIGPQLGIVDYSIKQTDDFGEITVVERPYSDTAEFQVLVENTFVDALKKLLTDLRATPILYLGSPDYTSMAVYGFFREFNIEVAYPTHSLTTISLEGLT